MAARHRLTLMWNKLSGSELSESDKTIMNKLLANEGGIKAEELSAEERAVFDRCVDGIVKVLNRAFMMGSPKKPKSCK